MHCPLSCEDFLLMLHHASCHRLRLGRSAYHSSVQSNYHRVLCRAQVHVIAWTCNLPTCSDMTGCASGVGPGSYQVAGLTGYFACHAW